MISGKKGQEMGGIIESFPIMFIVFFILVVFVVISAFLSPFAPEKGKAIFEYDSSEVLSYSTVVNNEERDIFETFFLNEYELNKEIDVRTIALKFFQENAKEGECLFIYGKPYDFMINIGKSRTANGELIDKMDFLGVGTGSEKFKVKYEMPGFVRQITFKNKDGGTEKINYYYGKCLHLEEGK